MQELKCRHLGGWMLREKGQMPVRERVGFGPQAHRALGPFGFVIICVHPNNTRHRPCRAPGLGHGEKG